MNDNERSNLARTIRKYREARKMTMKQLSIKSGINLSTIKKYETDNRNPKLVLLVSPFVVFVVCVLIFRYRSQIDKFHNFTGK